MKNDRFKTQEPYTKVSRTENERLRNIYTFLTSNLFLLDPEEVDATAEESTSIPSASAILLTAEFFLLRKRGYVSSPLYYAAKRPSLYNPRWLPWSELKIWRRNEFIY